MSVLAAFLTGMAVTAGLLALFYPQVFTASQITDRVNDIIAAAPDRERPGERVELRRLALANRLAEVAAQEQHRRQMTIKTLIAQAGYDWSVRRYLWVCVAVGVVVWVLLMMVSGSLLVAVPIALGLGYWLPRKFLKFRRARRIRDFLRFLPDALDAMARSMRAGLHISEALRIIVREGQEPLRSEFQVVADEQAIGSSLSSALERLSVRIPVDETRFLSLAISIQAGEGGGLSETLNSLASTMRERRKMNDKILSMTAEARASALLLANLPVAGLIMNFAMDPERTSLLWTTLVGQMTLGACIIWLTIGFFVMNRIQAVKV